MMVPLRLIPTYKIAMAAAQDAGNRHAKEAGREVWDDSDWDAATQTFNDIYFQAVANEEV